MWRSCDGTEPKVMGLEVLCKEFCDRQAPGQRSMACVWSSLFKMCSLLYWKSPDHHPRIAIQQKWRYITPELRLLKTAAPILGALASSVYCVIF